MYRIELGTIKINCLLLFYHFKILRLMGHFFLSISSVPARERDLSLEKKRDHAQKNGGRGKNHVSYNTLHFLLFLSWIFV